MTKETNWLWSPNKNYLGHWDLNPKRDIILTIKSAAWEDVVDPTNGRSEQKRIVRFVEDYKPMICNQTNAKLIALATQTRYFHEAEGKKIALFIGKSRDRKLKQDVDAVRVRPFPPKEIEKPALSEKELETKAVSYYKKNGHLQGIEEKRTITPEQIEQIKKLANNG